MSTHSIASLRHQTQLHGNTFLVAIELAHRLPTRGWGSVSKAFLAWKAHCCKRTVDTHVRTLLDTHLFECRRRRSVHGNERNEYRYIGPLHVTRPFPPATPRGATVASTLPRSEREKGTSLEEDLDKQKQGLRFYTPGSDLWTKTCEEIARLERLRRC
jgi:hypothetical protein